MTAEVVAQKSFVFTLNHQRMTCLLTDMWADRIPEQNPLTSLDGVKLPLLLFYDEKCLITYWTTHHWFNSFESLHYFLWEYIFDGLSKFCKGFWWLTLSMVGAVFPACFTTFPLWFSWSASILAVYNICSNALQAECRYLSHEWNQQVFQRCQQHKGNSAGNSFHVKRVIGGTSFISSYY